MEVFNENNLVSDGITEHFSRDNHSCSLQAGTVRGIHFQRPPFAQSKIVRCVRGRILDVAVDLRVGSPTYASYVAVELSEEEATQLYIPVGFGHGFMTLEPCTEVVYKVSGRCAPDHAGGIRWDDPQVAIDWPVRRFPGGARLSPKDWALPLLSEFDSPFVFETALVPN